MTEAEKALIAAAKRYVQLSFARETRTTAQMREEHSSFGKHPLSNQVESRLALKDAVDALEAAERVRLCVRAAEAAPPPPSKRECTCIGTCAGAEGLGPGWFCVMSKHSPLRCCARKDRHPGHSDDACNGNCCTTCGQPIDENKRCLCG